MYLPQPGITTGLREVGHTAHYDGVQIQVYSNDQYPAAAICAIFDVCGIPLIPAETSTSELPEIGAYIRVDILL